MIESHGLSFPTSKNLSVQETYLEMDIVPKNTLYVCAPVTTKSDLGVGFENTHISVVKRENLRQNFLHLNQLIQSGYIRDELLIPGLIGERRTLEKDWDEVDYNSFLFLCWLRIQKKLASHFVSDIALNEKDRREMSKYDQLADRRRSFYDIYRRKTVYAARRYGYDALPVIVLPRWKISLGCTLEVEIASELKIPTTFVTQQENEYILSHAI